VDRDESPRIVRTKDLHRDGNLGPCRVEEDRLRVRNEVAQHDRIATVEATDRDDELYVLLR
jgi:hypothetical protein